MKRLAPSLASALLLAAVPIAAQGDTAEPGFDVEDTLRIQRILEPPRWSPDGAALAYVAGDWQDETAIHAHKPLGDLRISGAGSDPTRPLARHASDPVWSRSGRTLAFFEGLGDARQLVVTACCADTGNSRSFAIPGERSRKSARHFAPIWTGDDRHLVVAEARLQDRKPPIGEPWSVTSATARLPFDTHFRDDTLWRLVRVDVSTGETAVITPELALRALHPDPAGDRLALAAARADAPGAFAGDEYVQPLDVWIVPLTANGAARRLLVDGIEAVLGWRDGATLLARTPTGIAAVDVDATSIKTVAAARDLPSIAGFALGGPVFAVWGPPRDGDRDAFVIAPPAPHELLVGDASGGTLRTAIGADAGLEFLDGIWLKPGGALLIHARRLDTLAEQLLLWDGARVEALLETDSALGPIAASPTAERLAFAAETATAPPELFEFELETRKTIPLTRLNTGLGIVDFTAPVLTSGTTEAGAPWRALLYRPEQADAPLVVRAYGRLTDQRHRFNAEAQLHVARGYAYLLPDVFSRRGALREAYIETLPAAVRGVREEFGLNGKTGFVGGSLGGYAGLVLLTQTDVADAAVLRAPPAEFALSWATGKDRDADLLEYLMLGERPDQDPAAYRADSPFWLADRVGTPVLFLHGSDDAQVPLAQSQWMFQALRRLGHAPAELRIYPGADHSIVRGNRAYYLDFYQQMFRWWERYLTPEQP